MTILATMHEDVYGPPSGENYEPEEEVVETVYGPPEAFGLEEDAD